MAAAVGRRRNLVFVAERDDRELDVVVRRGDGIVVAERRTEVVDGRFEVELLLPLGDLVVTASTASGRCYERALTVGPAIEAVRRIEVPRAR